MWTDQELLDLLRNTIPYYLIFAIPILIIISPASVDAAAEFTVYRLQQYDLHGVPHGSRNSLVNVEARTLDSNNLMRKCIVARLTELTPFDYQRLISESAAALLVLIPSNLTSLSVEEMKHAKELEATMLETEVHMAVYFAVETEMTSEIFSSVVATTQTDTATSAAAAMFGSLSADGYQLVVGGSQSKIMSGLPSANIQGKLSGYGVEEQLPTIGIVAYYDSFGIAPDLSWGGDSNGSGVVVLFELARILSKLYSSSRTHPKFNIVFLLSGGGFMNYQGSKRFLEDQLDSSDSSLLLDPHFTMCLDSLGSADELYMHVSKKPKESSPASQFFTVLQEIGSANGVIVDMIHKKINLQDDKQAWEHEKYSMRRLSAFTLSRLQSPKTGERGTVFDTVENVSVSPLVHQTSVIARALLRYIYNNSIDGLLSGGLGVSEESIRSTLSLLSTQPRSQQLLTGKNNPFINSLYEILSRFSDETQVTWFSADKRDPDWVFYSVTKATMTAYAVKPAMFDLFLSLLIISYLGITYWILQFFPQFYFAVLRLAAPEKMKIQ